MLPLAVLLAMGGCGENAPDPAPAANEASVNAAAPKATAPQTDKVRVRLDTDAGPIELELDARNAPVTTANFLAYVDQGRLDGTSFYRASRTRGAEERGFIQGGIQRNYRRMLPPVAHTASIPQPTLSTTGRRAAAKAARRSSTAWDAAHA